MAGRLAAVPEESIDCSTAAYTPPGVYCDRIRTVAMSGAQIRSTIFSDSYSQSGHSGSSYSSASNSYLSNNSVCSSRSASDVVPEYFRASNYYLSNNFGSSSDSASDVVLEYFRAQEELDKIACRMVSDGYIQRMVQAFNAASPVQAQALVLEAWFSDLDLGWVLQLQIGQQEHGSLRQLRLQDQSASQDLVERWIRGLTVIVQSIIALVSSGHQETMEAVARFGNASISKMLVFVDAIVHGLKAEKLQAALDMYICVYNASYMFAPVVMSAEAQGMFNETSGSLLSEMDRLKEAISSATMEEMRTVMDNGDDGLWAIEIKHGGGGIHKNTRLGVNFIMFMIKAMDLMRNSKMCDNSENLGGLVNDMINYLKDLLLRKSKSCTDLSLRYLFLLNNSHFITHECGSSFYFDAMFSELYTIFQPTPELTRESKNYMASYLDASWGHVLSGIPRSHFPGPIHRWINISSLTKFESAFYQTYHTQKFWKVPDPWLRDVLRRAITKRVISSYRDYLKEHPELAEHVNRESRSPEVLEGLLGELFEG